MNEPKVNALFLLAGIGVKALFKIENEYWRSHDDPWWLVQTDRGLIKIGWRKRVINIDWTDLEIEAEVTKDDVTKSKTNVHAWGYAKAVEYLSNLGTLMKRETESKPSDSDPNQGSQQVNLS